MDKKHDVVIPLGVKSYGNKDFEIRVAVASIKKYFKCLNRIIIVTQVNPIKSLGDDIVWVYADDIYTHDKDANIIHKIRTAIENVKDLTDDFIMWSDDQFITRDTHWTDTVPRYIKIYDESTKSYFDNMANKRIWWKRLQKCFNRFPNNGFGCKFFNPHIPSPMNKHKFIEMCNTFPYQTEDGITIYDLYYNFVGEKGVPNFDEFHCKCGETNWNGCRWVGFYNSSMRVPAFIRTLNNMFKL